MKQIRRSLMGALSLLAITAAPLTVASAVPSEEPTDGDTANVEITVLDKDPSEEAEETEDLAGVEEAPSDSSEETESSPAEGTAGERGEAALSEASRSGEETPKTARVYWNLGQGNHLSIRLSELAGEADKEKKDGSGTLFRGEKKDGTVGDAFLYGPWYTHLEGKSVLRQSFYEGDKKPAIFARFSENVDMKDVAAYVYCGNAKTGFTNKNRFTGELPYKNLPNFFKFEVPFDTLKELRAGVCYVTTATDAANATETMEGFDKALELTFYETGGDLPGFLRKNAPASEQVVEDATKTVVTFSGTYLNKDRSADPVWSLHYHYTDAATGQPATAEIVSGDDVIEFETNREGALPLNELNWQKYVGTADMTEYAKQSADCQGYFAIHLNGKSLWNPALIAERERVTGESFPSALEGMARFKQDVIFDQALCEKPDEKPEQDVAPSDDSTAKPKAEGTKSLAKTGVNSGVLGAVALALSVAGAGLVLAGRSRRNA